MKSRWTSLSRWIGTLVLGCWASASFGASVTFNRDIRPILSDNCFACHGFDAKKRKAGLRLDTPEGAFAANKEGRVAIKPGDLAASELWARLNTTNTDDVMPPPESHKQLTAGQKQGLRLWIEEGARYQKHWAFEPIAKPAVPAPLPSPIKAPDARPENPIDRFVRAKLAEAKLVPSTEADRITLIRRLSFDLRGLPPTPAEVDQFVRDTRGDAYERLVDDLLASPRYGEHMAKHWLDVARYADTHGLHLDNERQMWAYRDWVVNAFNRDEPFDQFTIEQLAGDLLPEPTTDQLVATGFNRCNVTTGEGGSIDAEWIFRYAVERTSTTVQAWLGLTAGCAVCHDHKFDPISQREFYSLYAFFHSAADPALDGNILRTAPTVQVKDEEITRRLADYKQEIRQAEGKVREALANVPYADPASKTPVPQPYEGEVIWMDDEVPPGYTAQGSSKFVGKESPVFSGRTSLRRQATDVSQDVFESSSPTLSVPQEAKLFAHVFLDPANLPKEIMLQFNTDGWEHRAVWGDVDAIAWGDKESPSRAHMGPLPKAGQWVRLEFDAEKVGLKPGNQVRGIAYTQFGGTVYWDKAGVMGLLDPVNDPLQSFAAWTRQFNGKDANGLPDELRKIFKEVASTNRTPEQVAQLRSYFLSRVCASTRPALAPLTEQVTAARKRHDDYNESIVQSFVFRDMEKPRESFVMQRGAYDRPGDRVYRGVPAVLPPLGNTNNPNRLDLARWLVSAENPLTARVTVNRLWQQFFGVGLVKTTEDFGSQGSAPSHPELLDWLASTFRDSGWRIKDLVKLMVTSGAYRQSSIVTPEMLQRDPENRLYARGPRFRLDAEQLRDNALFVSGLMDSASGGKGVRIYQPPNIWEPVGFVGSNTREYKQDTGSALYRRSLYAFFKRTAPAPFMANFDAPNREQSCTRREHSNTPLQALQLMNDVQHFEAARGLAQRLLKEGGDSPADRIVFGYRTVLGRMPSTQELTVVTNALEQHLTRYRGDVEAAQKAIAFGDSKPDASLPAAELAAYTLTANLLLNLDETITRN